MIPAILLSLAASPAVTAASPTVEAAAPPAVVSERLAHPLSVSGAFNLPMLNFGVDLSYHLLDRLALGVQATTMLAHNDISLRTRFFFVARPRWGLYVGANAHLIHSPIIFSFPAWAGTMELGWEYRTPGRTLFAVGVGGGRLWVDSTESNPSGCRACPWPLLNLRIGRAH